MVRTRPEFNHFCTNIVRPWWNGRAEGGREKLAYLFMLLVAPVGVVACVSEEDRLPMSIMLGISVNIYAPGVSTRYDDRLCFFFSWPLVHDTKNIYTYFFVFPSLLAFYQISSF